MYTFLHFFCRFCCSETRVHLLHLIFYSHCTSLIFLISLSTCKRTISLVLQNNGAAELSSLPMEHMYAHVLFAYVFLSSMVLYKCGYINPTCLFRKYLFYSNCMYKYQYTIDEAEMYVIRIIARLML